MGWATFFDPFIGTQSEKVVTLTIHSHLTGHSFVNSHSFMPIADTPCHLLTLPDEIIIEILSYLPVESILKLENACKHLYEICRSRQVWRSIIERLDINQAPNLLPYEKVETLSDIIIRRKVSNAVRTIQGWTSTAGDVPPTRVDELRLVHIEENKLLKARLLPGGKYLLLANFGDVELWSVDSGSCIWTIPAPNEHVDYIGFDFDLVEDGRVLLVAAVCDDIIVQSESLLRLYVYDFQCRTGELAFERRLPHVSPSRIMLQGDFFISSIPGNFRSVVINWKTGDALVLDFHNPTDVRIDARSKLLADNNLIVFVQMAESGFCAVKLPLNQLTNYWSDETDHHAWRRIPFRPSEQGYTVLPLPYPRDPPAQDGSTGYGPWILAHHVFRPPWRPDAPTEIFIVAYTVGPGGYTAGPDGETPMRLISFRLQLSYSEVSPSQDGTGTLTLVKSSSASIQRLPRNPRNITNAGLMFSLRHKLQCFSLFSDEEQPIGEAELDPEVFPQSDELEPNVTSVDPWSGAIAVRLPGMLKVLYFNEV